MLQKDIWEFLDLTGRLLARSVTLVGSEDQHGTSYLKRISTFAIKFDKTPMRSLCVPSHISNIFNVSQ